MPRDASHCIAYLTTSPPHYILAVEKVSQVQGPPANSATRWAPVGSFAGSCADLCLHTPTTTYSHHHTLPLLHTPSPPTYIDLAIHCHLARVQGQTSPQAPQKSGSPPLRSQGLQPLTFSDLAMHCHLPTCTPPYITTYLHRPGNALHTIGCRQVWM